MRERSAAMNRAKGMQNAAGAAFGKVILLGEHAVVHGVPAIACGIELGLRADVVSTDTSASELVLLAEMRRATDDDALGRAFAALLAAGSGHPRSPVLARVSGALPPGMNLGFSAAAAVALARALEALRGEVDETAVRARADAWEAVFHGNPSGIDVAAAIHGGFVRYRRGESVCRVVSSTPLRICIGMSDSKPGPTKAMVDSVSALQARHPETFRASLDAIAALVARAESALERGEVEVLGELMTMNHLVLAGWMLSTENIEKLCAAARDAGALGSKLTGAGGGGAMIALAGAAEDPASIVIGTHVIDAWRRIGCNGFEVVVGSKRG
jgi:mevalonate kinase